MYSSFVVKKLFLIDRRTGIRLLISVTALIIATVFFRGIAMDMQRNDSQIFMLDKSVADWFRERATPRWTGFIFVVSDLHSILSLASATFVISLQLYFSRRWYQLFILVFGVYGGMILNAILKLIFARQRPVLDFPLVSLSTYSFPSGHTMGATVFYGTILLITVPMLKKWWLQGIAFILAIAMILFVGATRIYLGAHYFSDILGAVLEGTAWLILCTILLPTKNCMRMDSSIEVIINTGSGSDGNTESLIANVRNQFAARGSQVHLFLCQTNDELLTAVDTVVEGPSKDIVVGGGDGTIQLVASRLIHTEKTLGILPLGTFNYFARNMSIPLTLEEAIETVVDGHTMKVTVGAVNDKIFLNNASLGLYPQLLEHREKIYDHIGRSRLAAYLAVLLVFLKRPSLLKLRLKGKHGDTHRRTPILFVYNNEFQMKEFDMPGHERVESGQLAFCLTSAVTALGLLKLALHGLFRKFRASTDLEVLCLDEAIFDLKREKIPMAIDGEVCELQTPLHFRAIPAGLRVFVPAKIRDSKKEVQ